MFNFLKVKKGWRESMLGAPRRLLVTLGSLSRDSSSCPATVKGVGHGFSSPAVTTTAVVVVVAAAAAAAAAADAPFPLFFYFVA
ncbi:hypothetical protein HZH68_014809 [Vespula germanica]|uniref:Uncharacterized protein n=1 Tax=Vespula germanica TaxID=30212 RepID=A0A834J9Q7_VESGE|nr:hypothetical protein HZH68_014809 [Vespula germanica]